MKPIVSYLFNANPMNQPRNIDMFVLAASITVIFFLISVFLPTFLGGNARSQNIGINTTGNTPNASAMLDVSSTTSGLLLPRMTKAQRDAIASPATGLLIYQTDNVPGFYYYNGSQWVSLVASGGSGASSLPGFWQIMVGQYNFAGQVISDLGGIGIQNCVGGASTTDMGCFLTTFMRGQTQVADKQPIVNPETGVNLHIKTDIYQEIDVSTIRTAGRGALFTGFTTTGTQITRFYGSASTQINYEAYGFHYDKGDNTIYALANDGTGAPVAVNTGYTVSVTGDRHEYEVVLKGTSSIEYYIDGNLVATINQTIPVENYNLLVGGLANATANGHVCMVYGASVWRD